MIQNFGTQTGSDDVTLTFDGVEADSRQVSLNSSDDETVSLSIELEQSLEAGSYEAVVATSEESRHSTVQVQAYSEDDDSTGRSPSGRTGGIGGGGGGVPAPVDDTETDENTSSITQESLESETVTIGADHRNSDNVTLSFESVSINQIVLSNKSSTGNITVSDAVTIPTSAGSTHGGVVSTFSVTVSERSSWPSVKDSRARRCGSVLTNLNRALPQAPTEA